MNKICVKTCFQIFTVLVTFCNLSKAQLSSRYYTIANELQRRSNRFQQWYMEQYDNEDERESCWQYNWHGKHCIENGCYYIPHDQTCVASPDYYSCKPDKTCSQHYGRPCDCKQALAGCEPDPTDSMSCRRSKQVCNEDFHKEIEKHGFTKCLRSTSYYLGEHHSVCLNFKEYGIECSGDDYDVVLAVNINGNNFVTDYRNITYAPDYEYDPYQIRVPGFVIDKNVSEVRWRWCTVEEYESAADCRHPGEVELYSTFIFGNVSLANSGLCASYVVPIEKIGLYELGIKMVNCENMNPGEHVFSIKIDEQIVVKNLDVRARVKDCERMELIILFEVFDDIEENLYRRYPPPSRKRLRTLSHQRSNAIKIEWDQIMVSFCFGESTPECPYKYTTFIVSAFHVAYLGNLQTATVEDYL